MSDMMNDAQVAIQAVLAQIMGNETEAIAYSEAPREYLIDHGINDYDLSEVDLGSAVNNVANELNFNPTVTQTLIEVPAPAPASAPSRGGFGWW